MKGYLSRERIKFGFGIPISRPLAYSTVREHCAPPYPGINNLIVSTEDLETMLIKPSQRILKGITIFFFKTPF